MEPMSERTRIIAQLRRATAAPLHRCVAMLSAADGDPEEALRLLRAEHRAEVEALARQLELPRELVSRTVEKVGTVGSALHALWFAGRPQRLPATFDRLQAERRFEQLESSELPEPSPAEELLVVGPFLRFLLWEGVGVCLYSPEDAARVRRLAAVLSRVDAPDARALAEFLVRSCEAIELGADRSDLEDTGPYDTRALWHALYDHVVDHAPEVRTFERLRRQALAELASDRPDPGV